MVAGAAGEAGIAAAAQARLEHTGFTVSLVPTLADEDQISVVAVPAARHEGPTVVLNGHLDTVGVAGMPDPFVPLVEGDRL